ncbi:hypothetical protein AQUCO_03600007v1 [Aquilegia coerulea]|uniref:Homeobox domain-containing protein n=1 Tax=Aquilegia coerulea TaxID=218851 RepID=A0A2G5CUU9_AQUCA|nr:hypothetical protein AQUCO_03600007v1 [Aquilegia coerulea]
MASSNRHWPSMFKTKPCNPHHQWQHDISPTHNIPHHQKAPYASGSEERSPDPKPRWNPKPEQIRILEAIFNSGMVNPPRDEIRRIRVQLQEYGQVGDANVFYWFQNRKSRSKHKQRSHLHTSKSHTQSSSVAATTFVGPSSSSSSSEKSPPKRTNKLLQMGSSGMNIMDAANSPTASVNQTYFQSQGDFSADPFFYPVAQQAGNNNTLFSSQGLCFPELSNIVQIPDQVIVPCTGFLLSELVNQNATKRYEEEEKLKLEQQLSYSTAVTTTNSTTTTTTTTTTPNTIPSSSTSVGSININQIQGGGESGAGGLGLATAAMKSTVFINNVAVEVALGPFNVRDAFGEDALLVHSSGQPVVTNEWGVTLQSLQPGAVYYLVCASNIFA